MREIDFLYGTAWKEELTESCVRSALRAGYRAFDTANQRKHYFEEGVGNALSLGGAELGIRREDLFLQTKFTFSRGQDHRKPYDETDPIGVQVQESFSSSLQHLKTEYLDSYVLHGPSTSQGLVDSDWEAWDSMEKICASGKAKLLGVSNVSYDQLAELHAEAGVKPSFVQNRCFAETRWDQEIRLYCLKNGIRYQGFSLLTANWRFLGGTILRPEDRNIPQLVFAETDSQSCHEEIRKIVTRTGKNIQQIIFRFAQQLGMIPITGTRSEKHMKSNREITDFTLSAPQMETLENIAFLS